MSSLTLGPDAVEEVDEFVHTFVVWGQHAHDEVRRWSIDEMRLRIPEYPQLVADVRSGYPVKWFENLLNPTWQVTSPVAGTAVQNPTTGEQHSLDGSGVIVLSTYEARFSTAVEAWHRAITRANPADLLTAAGDGFAAMEGYVNDKARLWTATHPNDPLEDSKKNPVRILDKFKKWVPHMTEGKRIDTNSAFWRHLGEMQRYRNEEAIHPHGSSAAIDLAQFASQLNMFTSGIAIPLLQLHMLFKEQIPSVIIRAAYAPEVRIAPEGVG